jgi:hypothetical protein
MENAVTQLVACLLANAFGVSCIGWLGLKLEFNIDVELSK